MDEYRVVVFSVCVQALVMMRGFWVKLLMKTLSGTKGG